MVRDILQKLQVMPQKILLQSREKPFTFHTKLNKMQ